MAGNKFTTSVSIILVSALLAALSAATISCTPEGEVGESIGVSVTILPLADFVENVGGEKVAVSAMVPPGANLHTYELTPSQLAALDKAKVYAQVGSGVEFELVWMEKLVAANQEMLVVDCSHGVELIGIAGEHRHHGAPDPHIWLSPLNAKIMVQNICHGLVQVDPDHRAYYEQNRDIYLQRLTRLDQDIRDGLSGVMNRTFMVYHHAFGYFARDYDLDMIPIEEEGKEPSAADIAHLIERAQGYQLKVILASPQFNPQSAEVIAGEIGGRVVLIDPLGRDYIANLRLLLGELVQVMV